MEPCQNCTQIVNDLTITTSQSEQNCWIVFLVSIIFIIGLYKLLKILVMIINPLSFIPFNLYERYASNETKTWALITGGSQGIGLGFAEELARRNFNIIIVSRSQDKLKKAKQEILKINDKIEVKYIPVDFQKYRTPEQYQQFVKSLDQYDISLLVNNVGYFNPYRYMDLSYQQIKRQAVLNLLPITSLTRLFMPKMFLRNKKYNKKSGIINLASASAQGPLSYSAHYCATKAFDDLLTRSIQAQYRNQSVDILSLRPYLVTSAMTRNQSSILHVTANQCANGALNDLGKISVSYGPLWHRIQGVLVEQLNGKIVNKILCLINKKNSMQYKELDQKNK